MRIICSPGARRRFSFPYRVGSAVAIDCAELRKGQRAEADGSPIRAVTIWEG